MSNDAPMIHIVDDDPSVGLSISRLLESVGYQTNTFSSGKAYLASGDCGKASCVVLDMRMPQMSGLQLQKELLHRYPEITVVFLTGYGTIPMAVNAIRAGAVDCLEKPFPEHQLIESINRAIAQYEFNCDKLREKIKLQNRLQSLTPREREVFALVVQGKPNKLIGAELFISEKTVKIHRARVIEKMCADSLPALVRMADLLSIST
ncbi:response regulator [Desulfobacula sp.]|uniref:response regulator transcription factor n=1 Tax=Desulfobacula sp. TaxID=2593537 RepID=UPI0025BA0D43|nr:response regulator [Desulfobacula sp.]